MVSPTTARLASNLFYAGRQFFNNYMQTDQSPNERQTNSPISTEYLVHNWLEAGFAYFQMAILWHDLNISIGFLSVFFSSFLLLTYFAPRFYATILIAIFCYNLIIVWFRHIWPEIRVPPEEGREEESRLDVDRWTHLHPQLMTIKELNQSTENLIKICRLHLQRLFEYRRNEPVKFCLLVCSIFSCTAVLGNLIDGSYLLGCITTSLLIGPGIYLHLLPNKAKEYLSQHVEFFNNQSITVTKQKPEPESSLSSTLSTPLSLFDQLKQNSSFLLSQGSISEVKEKEYNSSEPVQMQVPPISNILTNEINDKQSLDEKSSCCHSDPIRAKDDLSSNESTSLIDFEDDQQDGFVIL